MLKKSLLVLGLSVGLVSNMLGNEPVRTRKSVVEVDVELSLEDIVLEVSEVVLEEVEEVELPFEFLYPTLEVSEVELEEVEEEPFVFLFETLVVSESVLENVEEKYQENINL